MKTPNIIKLSLMLIAGLFLGWLVFSPHKKVATTTNAVPENKKGKQWTCIMHRQILKNEPGKCPICGMTLVPVDSLGSSNNINKDAVYLSKEAMALANIETTPVTIVSPMKMISLTGTVQADEQNIFSQTAHVPGRVDKLYINFTGQNVSKGQVLASIYSPALVTAQQELIEAMGDTVHNKMLLEAAIEKLKSWKLTDKQIYDIEKSKQVNTEFDIVSDFSGVVTKRMVASGDYVKDGDILLQVTDLNHVWLLFDAYQSELPWLKVGDKINFTGNALSGKTFTAKVSFIDPVVNPQTLATTVRAEIDNTDGLLKPGMFINGQVMSMLNIKGNVLVVPKSAVLWTGKRSVVYVKDTINKIPSFTMREVTLSSDIGSYYIVANGLMQGEEVVSNGVFQVDAAAQLAGKPSMMNNDTTTTGKNKKNVPGMANMPGM